MAITVITVEEQLSGWYAQVRQAKNPSDLAKAYQRLARSVKSLARLQIVAYTERAIARYNALRRSHRNIRKNDLRIAAIVLEQTVKLVSRNKADFGQIPGLQIEDWTA